MANALALTINRAVVTRTSPLQAVKGSLSAWLGQTIGLTTESDGSYWRRFLGAESSSGKCVTVDSALCLSAVWACVRLISETIATLPFPIYERKKNGDRAIAPHRLTNILRYQPNAEMTAVCFWEAVVASMLLRGNAYIEKIIVAGEVVSLNFLLPSRMQVRRKSDGSYEYIYTLPNTEPRTIPENKMMHIPAFSLDGIVGLTPIAYGANVLGAAMSADEAAASTFKNGLMPTTYFSVDKILKPEQRAEIRESMKAVSGALNSGKQPVLEAGMTAGTIGINPNDAQLLESRSFSVEQICQFFRTPPIMIGHGDKQSSWPTSTEAQGMLFLTYSLRPWLLRIEQAVRRSLFKPEERDRYFAEFGIEALLRADSAGRASYYSTMVQNGLMTRDEVRRKENLPAHGGNAEVLTVQVNLAPLDSLGTVDDSQAAKWRLMDSLFPEVDKK